MTNLKTNQKKIYKIAIIGGGAGGIFASTMASYFNLSNILLEKKSSLGGQPIELYPNKHIYDFPCFPEIKSSEVIKKLIIQNNKYENACIKTDVDIKNIYEVNFKDNPYFLFETNQETFLAEKIIIATGNGSFNPRKLEINNVEIKSNLINYSIELNKNIYKNKKIIVLGGGDSAVEWANYFVEENISQDVTIVHRRDKYRSSLFMIESLKKNNITQKLNYEIVDFNEQDKLITIMHNETNQQEILNFDYLIVQYGQIASPINIKIFNDLEKEKGKYKIDLNQKTSHKNIYAIGDATYFNCKPNTIITACADAIKALWHISKNKYENKI